jgi:two-component system response regulator RegA
MLVVEDDEALLDGLATMFQQEGFAVTSSSTYENARECLRQEAFEVLVTDVRLGPYNGLQLAVVAHALDPSIRLVIISGFDDPVLRAEADDLGATYLVKPVGTARLLDVVRGM